MYDPEKLDQLRKSQQKWEETSLKKALSSLPERQEDFITTSSESINRLYGPLDVEDRVISKFILTAMRGGVIKVNGANETLDFTYVDDAVGGIVAATLSEHQNKTYNITKSHSKTLLEAAKLAVQIVGQGTIEVRDRDADFPSRGALNIDAARRDLGFDPKVDIDEGFQRYYEWLDNSVYWSKKTV